MLKNEKKAKSYNVHEAREFMRKKKELFRETKLKIEAEKKNAAEERKQTLIELDNKCLLLVIKHNRNRSKSPNTPQLNSAKEVDLNVSATIIQACFRGFLARKHLKERVQTNEPQKKISDIKLATAKAKILSPPHKNQNRMRT